MISTPSVETGASSVDAVKEAMLQVFADPDFRKLLFQCSDTPAPFPFTVPSLPGETIATAPLVPAPLHMDGLPAAYMATSGDADSVVLPSISSSKIYGSRDEFCVLAILYMYICVVGAVP